MTHDTNGGEPSSRALQSSAAKSFWYIPCLAISSISIQSSFLSIRAMGLSKLSKRLEQLRREEDLLLAQVEQQRLIDPPSSSRPAHRPSSESCDARRCQQGAAWVSEICDGLEAAPGYVFTAGA